LSLRDVDKLFLEFLGDGIARDRGINCSYIIAKKPSGAPVTERVIPTVIFAAEETIMSKFVHKWMHDGKTGHIDIRDVIDWDYYRYQAAGHIVYTVFILYF
jgi:DNA polymerase epsilon subunit 1